MVPGQYGSQEPRNLHVYKPLGDSDEDAPRIALWELVAYVFRGKRDTLLKKDKFVWKKCFVGSLCSADLFLSDGTVTMLMRQLVHGV